MPCRGGLKPGSVRLGNRGGTAEAESGGRKGWARQHRATQTAQPAGGVPVCQRVVRGWVARPCPALRLHTHVHLQQQQRQHLHPTPNPRARAPAPAAAAACPWRWRAGAPCRPSAACARPQAQRARAVAGAEEARPRGQGRGCPPRPERGRSGGRARCGMGRGARAGSIETASRLLAGAAQCEDAAAPLRASCMRGRAGRHALGSPQAMQAHAGAHAGARARACVPVCALTGLRRLAAWGSLGGRTTGSLMGTPAAMAAATAAAFFSAACGGEAPPWRGRAVCVWWWVGGAGQGRAGDGKAGEVAGQQQLGAAGSRRVATRCGDQNRLGRSK